MSDTPSNNSPKLRADHYRPGDEVDILALNRSEYGVKNVMVNADDFNWRYAENPAGQADITVIRDEQSQRVVGFTWMIPLYMRLYGQTYLAALTVKQLAIRKSRRLRPKSDPGL